jgi:hypothetical protein
MTTYLYEKIPQIYNPQNHLSRILNEKVASLITLDGKPHLNLLLIISRGEHIWNEPRRYGKNDG